MDSRLHLVIKGRVQGVFYRASARKKAIQLSIKGWVRNLDSGHVEILAEGRKENLQELLKWSWQGPPAASVDDIEISWQEFKCEFDSFSVRY